jgi:hypothetical protein
MNVDTLLAAARNDPDISELTPARWRGAQAFLDAVKRVAETDGHTDAKALSDAALNHLAATASGPEDEADEFVDGSFTACKLLVRLSEQTQP